MRLSYATFFACDGCGTVEHAPPPDLPTAYGSPIPDGWLGYGEKPGMAWYLGDPFGMQFRDLCPECLMRPFGELVEMIKQRAEALAGGK